MEKLKLIMRYVDSSGLHVTRYSSFSAAGAAVAVTNDLRFNNSD